MKTNIGLNDSARKSVSAILNTLLSDEYVLLTKTRNYHWNVTGINFSELHKFFEGQYDVINGAVDEIAERTRQLGERSFGSLTEFKSHARIKEDSSPVTNPRDMLMNLLSDHETVIQSLRTDLDACTSKYQDAGTSDFLTGLMESHEKMAWMLRASLEG